MPAFSVLSGTPQTRSTRIFVVTVFLVILFLFLGNSQLTAGPYLGSTTDAELSPEHFANQHKQAASNGRPPADAADQASTHHDSGEVKDQPLVGGTGGVDGGHDHDHDHDDVIEEPNEAVPDQEMVPDQDVWHDEKEDERLAAPLAPSSEPGVASTSALPAATSKSIAPQPAVVSSSAIPVTTSDSIAVASSTTSLRNASEIDN
ncbi:hypothetical protein ACHAQH_008864 [Verticillium albo-atrum]